MKLRVKHDRSRVVVEVLSEDNAPTATLQRLREAIATLFTNITPDFTLSMNGQDTLDADPETPLSELGIVSGDLIVVKTKTAVEPEQPSTSHGSACQPTEKPSTSVSSECATAVEEGSTESDITGTSAGIEAKSPVRDVLVNRYLREPIQVAESTPEQLPTSLQEVFRTIRPASAPEALVLVLHVLMQETGFTLEEECLPHTIPASWRRPGSCYQLRYRHSRAQDISFVLMAVQMGHVLVMHAHGAPAGVKTRSVDCKLKIPDYVAEMSEVPQRCYRHLSLLSRTFKDAIAHKILFSATQDDSCGLTLTTLPPEIQGSILQYLGAADLVRLASTCKQLQACCEDPAVWKRRLGIDYPGFSWLCADTRHPLQIYKGQFLKRKRLAAPGYYKPGPFSPGGFIPPGFPHLPPNHPDFPGPEFMRPPGHLPFPASSNPNRGRFDPLGVLDPNSASASIPDVFNRGQGLFGFGALF